MYSNNALSFRLLRGGAMYILKEEFRMNEKYSKVFEHNEDMKWENFSTLLI